MELKYLFLLFSIPIVVSSNNTTETVETTEYPFRGLCFDDNDCVKHLGEGSVCKNNKCTCSGNCKSQTKNLVTKIGEECIVDEQCNIEDAECRGKKCECHIDLVVSMDKRKCLKVSTGLRSECEEDVQCLAFLNNSVCSKNNICICANNYHTDGKTCFPNINLGGKCSSDEECSHIKHSVCETIYCECRKGYTKDTAGEKCLSLANVTHNNCTEDVQCTFLGQDGIKCRNGECVCKDNYRLENFKCEKDGEDINNGAFRSTGNNIILLMLFQICFYHITREYIL